MTEVLNVSRDKETDEITQFLILADSGLPETKLATPENMLLYDPEDELPFEGGMHEFLSGDSALRLSEDPYVAVGQAGDEYTYIINLEGSIVETTPEQCTSVLEAVYDAIAVDNLKPLKKIHSAIMSQQVRRPLMNALWKTFDERKRIDVTDSGWLVDSLYLIDWNAKLYTSEDSDDADYIREGDEAIETDKSYEFVRLQGNLSSVDEESVIVGGSEYVLTEREMLFLAKVTWVLNRRHYHPDEPFWSYTDRWADLPEEEPNLDLYEF